jgi:hypothetical protein
MGVHLNPVIFLVLVILGLGAILALATVPIALAAALVQYLRGQPSRLSLLIALISGVAFIVLLAGLALVLALGGDGWPAGILQDS